MKMNPRLLKQLSRATTQWMDSPAVKAATAAMQRNMEQTMRDAAQAVSEGRVQGAAQPSFGAQPPFAQPAPFPAGPSFAGAGGFAMPGSAPAREPDGGDLVAGRHAEAAGAREYRLYVPAAPEDEHAVPGRTELEPAQPGLARRGLTRLGLARPGLARPGLLVMLHGCTQDAAGFAHGTQMNALAAEAGCLVLYPQQAHGDNPAKCWNWFNPGDQRRGGGEPAILAGMTRRIAAEHGVDPERIYVAGLSAGGAMAVILAHTYPELFRACGVHSGLPYACASDVQSAMQAMKAGGESTGGAMPVPTIVLHGDRDATVSPRNGATLLRHALAGAGQADCAPVVETGHSDAGVRFTRSIYADGGAVLAEHWVIHGGAHAWSGGAQGGSYTDPRGPDASRAMLRFFARQAPR